MSGQCSRCALIAAEAKARVEKSLVAGNAATSSRTEVLSGESPGNPRAIGAIRARSGGYGSDEVNAPGAIWSLASAAALSSRDPDARGGRSVTAAEQQMRRPGDGRGWRKEGGSTTPSSTLGELPVRPPARGRRRRRTPVARSEVRGKDAGRCPVRSGRDVDEPAGEQVRSLRCDVGDQASGVGEQLVSAHHRYSVEEQEFIEVASSRRTAQLT